MKSEYLLGHHHWHCRPWHAAHTDVIEHVRHVTQKQLRGLWRSTSYLQQRTQCSKLALMSKIGRERMLYEQKRWLHTGGCRGGLHTDFARAPGEDIHGQHRGHDLPRAEGRAPHEAWQRHHQRALTFSVFTSRSSLTKYCRHGDMHA